MNNRTIAIVIIALCSLSIIIGIFSSAFHCKKADNQINGFTSMFEKQSGGDKIALITLEGAITSEVSDGFIGEIYSAESVKKSLRRALLDNSVKGVLLRIRQLGWNRWHVSGNI